MKTLFATYLALMILLATTVAAVYLPLGHWSALVSLTIAVLKTLLVVCIFMELRSASSIVRLTAGAALLWLFFFYFLASTDTQFRPHISDALWK